MITIKESDVNVGTMPKLGFGHDSFNGVCKFFESQKEADDYYASLPKDIEQERQLIKDTIIDTNTPKLIYKGFTYAGLSWSMSDKAQSNWLAIQSRREEKFPINLLSQEGKLFVLNFNERDAFIDAAWKVKEDALESGSLLKLQLDALETIEEVLNFTDPR